MRIISILVRALVLSALIYSPSSFSAITYVTAGHASAKTSCEAEQNLTNHYYCEIAVFTSITTSGSNSYIGQYIVKNPSGSIINQYYWGWLGTVKPASYTCPNTYGGTPYSYSATTGLCSGTNTKPQSCTLLNGWYVAEGGAFPDYIVGQGCQWDVDADNLLQHLDNCDDIYNPDQVDSDSDGIGDVCDACAPSQYQYSYTGPGSYVKSSVPASVCDSHLCTLTLTINSCSSGQCTINYNASGVQCTSVNLPNLSSYITQAPSSYGFDLNADNNSFALSGGMVQIVGLNQSQKFMITNCVRSSTQVEWSTNTVPCSGFDSYLNICNSPSEIDSNIVQYYKSNPMATSVSVSGTREYYNTLTDNILKSGSLNSLGGTYDYNLGTDDGNGSYEMTMVSTKLTKNFDYNSTTPYWVSSNLSNYGVVKFSLQGCTGGTASGGSGSGSGSTDMSILNDAYGTEYSSISPDISSLQTQVDDYNNGVLSDIESAPDRFAGEDINASAPSFFNEFTSLFQGHSCASLIITKLGYSVDILAFFCDVWDVYGRPVFSLLIYFYTLMGIAEIWLRPLSVS